MTPRRILLMVAGVLLFGGVFLAYDRVLGWLDGLPQLPVARLQHRTGDFQPPVRTTSPTLLRLVEAFGPNCPEERDDGVYETRLEFRNGDSSMVLAAGKAPLFGGSKLVTLTPFSLAVFGKPRPERLRLPDEVTEISTFHADKAILEFDRAIHNPNDMQKAKLIRMELVSDPENVPPDPLKRQGKVHIVNNQRSADPNRHLVIRTPGPVFYRDPKAFPGAGGPDVWTDAFVEIVDRQNLPRGFSNVAPKTAENPRGEDLRDAAVVAHILTGERAPPPTMTGLGMRIYLEGEKPPAPNQPAKKGSVGFSGVRRMELQEKVLLHLWTDSSQTFMSTPDKPAAKTEPKPAPGVEPPAAAAAVAGGFAPAVLVLKQLDRALIQIETLGPFSYDVEKNTARFDVVPLANPNLPNDVQVTRVAPRAGLNTLFSEVLEIEFLGSPTGPRSAPEPGKPAGDPAAGASFKKLHAWTNTPGRFLSVSAESDKMEASGQDLVFEQAANTTRLKGSPLHAVQGKSILTAGGVHMPGILVMEPDKTSKERKTAATVLGPGRIEILDDQTGDNTITATWLTSFVHTKEVISGREYDLLTFTDGAVFRDVRADYWVKGDVLKLWLEPAGPKAAPVAGKPDKSNQLPHRLQSIGNVTSNSADFHIEKADHLNVMFREGLPPPPPKVEAKPAAPPQPMNPAAGPMPPTNNAVAAEERPKEPEKPKPPMKLTARVIDTWVVRMPVKAPPAKPDAKPGAGANPAAEDSIKYELERAHCEGGVVVHQDPTDPTPPPGGIAPRGVDMSGQTLNIVRHGEQGSVMKVIGTEQKPGEVHQETTSIIGPDIEIDQVNNRTVVVGRGTLVMASGSDLSGAELRQPEVMVIHWRDGMKFEGARKFAEFFGKVNARQAESWLVCHTLQVGLDRPVFFSQLNKPEPKKDAKPDPKADPKAKNNPKIEWVKSAPVPGDESDDPRESQVTFQEVTRDEKGKIVKMQMVTAVMLEMWTRVLDERGEPYQSMLAQGPGRVRTWQPGQQDGAAPGAPPPAAPQPGAAAKEPDSEMKLTLVKFGGRMSVADKAQPTGEVRFQEARFFDAVEVTNLPSLDPNLVVERGRQPPGALFLTCTDQMTVSTFKRGKEPAHQEMSARGNSFMRSDEYEGSGEVITAQGPLLTLYGNDPTRPGPRNNLARIKGRFGGGTDQSAETIVFNRVTNRYETKNGTGGTIQSTPQQPKPPAPKGP